MPQNKVFAQMDLSGGVQAATSHLLKKRNEVIASKNATYNEKIGSAKRRLGYEQVGQTVEQGKDGLGAIVYRYNNNYKTVVGINNSADTNATLKYLDGDGYWVNILTNAPVNTRFQMLNELDELYVAGASDNNTFMSLTNIDSTFNVSTSRNVYTAPACKFIAEYQSELYAINCYVDGKYYPDRFYYSTPAIGAITFVQTDQKGLLKQLRVDSVQYIKKGMQLDIYSAGTEAKVQSSITVISVDKKNRRFSFVATSIDVKDNDEIWLVGTKGKLSHFWNTDHPTPESANWRSVPNSKEEKPEFTGWGKNNNRLFLFTKNTFLKFDGENLITVSDTVGCASHETIQNIGSWTIWLHDSGVWGYNDNTGQLKLLSRSVEPYIKAINQSKISKASAVATGRVYKLALGELLPLGSITTSTSTSSTSTSSTSSSTSSTSTSSTSTSSTSSSTSKSTISTSSTSASTSSTSASTFTTSTSSTSSSTSTSSTSTSTVASTKAITRLCYDFDLNAWWTEDHKREIRFQFNHSASGYNKPYFTDETGRLFRDETTNTDHVDPIPFSVELGRNNLGSDQKKIYSTVLVDSEDARGAIVQYSIDGGPFRTLGQITEKVTKLVFSQGIQLREGRDINYKLVHNDTGDPPTINGISTYFSVSEDRPNEV